jgi:hypothetical protein
MPLLLNRMPFPNVSGEVAVRGERVRVRADQIIVWVSLSLRRLTNPTPVAVPFPAILDTGHNHTFSLSEYHLRSWAGLTPDVLDVLAAVRDRGRRIDLRSANLWVHTNAVGQREVLSDGPPHRLIANAGIAVYPGDDFPRLPILGLRAIAENDLLLTVNGRTREATLRTPRRWWPFA